MKTDLEEMTCLTLRSYINLIQNNPKKFFLMVSNKIRALGKFGVKW